MESQFLGISSPEKEDSTNCPTISSYKEETEVDDLRLLNCSKFLRIREITIYSYEYIAGIELKYRLPNGQMIESLHSAYHPRTTLSSLNKSSKRDYHEWKSITLGPEENITGVSWGYIDTGVTSLTLKTSEGREIVVNGKEACEHQNVKTSNLTEEGKILAGLKTSFEQELIELSLYVTTLSKAKLEDLLKENKVVIQNTQVTKRKIRKKKSKRRTSDG